MSKKEKLLEKCILKPHDITFRELEALLRHFGFARLKTNAGSHFKWRNEEKVITYMVPRRNPVKPVYIKEFLLILRRSFNLVKNGSSNS